METYQRFLRSDQGDGILLDPDDAGEIDILFFMDMSRRTNIAFQVLGIDEHQRRIATVILREYPNSVPMSVILHETKLPRSTVLRRLQVSESRGAIIRQDEGNGRISYVYTGVAYQGTLELVHELFYIINGKQVGFSEHVLDLARKAGMPVDPEAATLSFPTPNKPY